jgi:cytochrome c oxidase subunit 4
VRFLAAAGTKADAGGSLMEPRASAFWSPLACATCGVERRADGAPNLSAVCRRGRAINSPILVWLILLVILAASAWSAVFPFHALNPAVNLLLAAVMIFLLATMDLRHASALLRLIAVAGLFWMTFLFALTFTDYLSRRTTGSPPSSHTASFDAARVH